MDDTTNSSSTLVEVYENCLARPLQRKNLSRHPLTHQELSRLAEAVSEHYKIYQLPQKSPSELRPSISPSFTTSQSVGLDYVSGEKHFSGPFKYKFDATSEGEMTANLKRYLLYCHGLVFPDPLPYLLDYFRGGTVTDVGLQRVPAVNALLSEYADLKDLIDKRILLPFAHHQKFLNDAPILHGAMAKTLEDRLPEFSPFEVRMLAHTIIEEQHFRRRLEDKVDLFFPRTFYVIVLRELLKITEEKFTSAAISEPFGLSVLGSVSPIRAQAITTQDLVRIRTDDELFGHWRAFLSRVFREVQGRELNSNSIDEEYALVVQQEFRAWRDKFDDRLKRGSVDRVLAESGKNISIGVISGAVTGVVTADPITGALAGAVASLTKPTIELLKNIIQASINKPGAATLRHHFLALGLADDELGR